MIAVAAAIKTPTILRLWIGKEGISAVLFLLSIIELFSAAARKLNESFENIILMHSQRSSGPAFGVAPKLHTV